MKKYKLLQNLPLAKAGDEVNVEFKSVDFIITNDEGATLAVGNATDWQEWLEEIPEKPKSVWELKEGDRYYRINQYGDVVPYKFSNNEIDEDNLRSGNIFLTEEEARQELEKRRAIQRIKKYCHENNIDTKFIEGETNCSFCINLTALKIENHMANYFKDYSPIGHFSQKDAKKILENFEEELRIILE